MAQVSIVHDGYEIDGKFLRADWIGPEKRAELDALAAGQPPPPPPAQPQYMEPVYVPKEGAGFAGGGAARKMIAPGMTYSGNPEEVMSIPGGNGDPAAQSVAPSPAEPAPAAPSPQQMAPGLPGLGGSPAPSMPSAPSMAMQTTTQIAPKLAKGTIAGLESAAEATAKAERQAMEVVAQNKARQGEILQLESMRQNFQNAAEAEAESARQTEVQAQVLDIQESVKALESKSIDPDRRWKEMGTGGQIGTAVSLMLGAIGAALTKGPNYALDMYQKAVDQDIDAQRAEIAKAQSVVGLKNNALSQLMAKGASERQAIAALRAQKLEAVQTALKAEALKDDSKEVQARAIAAEAAAEERKKKFLADLELATKDRVTIQTAPVTGAGKELQERAVYLPGGGVAYAPDPESARKIREQSASTMSIQQKTDRLIKLTQSYTGKVLPGAVKDEIRATINDLVMDYGKAKQQGAMGEEEFDRMKSLFKDPSSFFVADSRAVAAAQAFRQRSDAGFINTLMSNGMIGARK